MVIPFLALVAGELRERDVHDLRGKRPVSAAVAPGRVPRVSRLLALALRLDRLVRAGEIADYATLARLGYVSRARVSQILQLLLLAPDIQETLLLLPCTERGRDPIHDGGFTGGNFDRPALQRLLEAIAASQVDCVLVQKVDRLSRSLLEAYRDRQVRLLSRRARELGYELVGSNEKGSELR
jgi:Resolvase, N terminal domain